MGEFWRFLGVAATAATLAMTLRSAHKEMGAAFAAVSGLVLMLLLADKLQLAVDAAARIAAQAALEKEQTAGVIRVLGIAMIVEFAAQACRDAGEEGIALRVELGGKVMLAVLSLPLLEEIANVIMELTE